MKRALAALCVSMLCGCTNLGAVRDISSRLTTASVNWNDVGADIAGSCERQRTINPKLTDCLLEKKASDGLAGANAVLGAYFKALMSAANESNFTIQPGLSAATASVAEIPGVNTDQVKAVSGLFGLIANLVTAKMREDTLRDLIDRGGLPARTVVTGMNDLVVPRLTRQLEAEKIQLTAQFARLLAEQRDNVGADPSVLCVGSQSSKFSGPGFLLTLEYCRRLAVIDKRTKALADYAESLKAADTALAELQSSRTRLKTADLAQRLYSIGSDLDTKISAVRKAFA
ncbi:hypothetical protein P7B04_15345 [Sphingobium yanoikuyae]|uniref:hypothetical protein n=1 Tax=Sphingobium yanoikuyae TaxID=13690 RepID=UPI00240F8C38|nr:hypothetical protein [Sphingobium yanoikuyae]MDG2514071.1 hypothetical protein [Sphingobium yanoikuyae]